MNWLALKDTLLKNKWLLALAGIIAALYYGGNTIVACVAYFQPKVIVVNVTKTIDRSVTKREVTTFPDGTTKTLEEIRADIQSITSSSESREPVLANTRHWGLYTHYAFRSHLLSIGPTYDLGLVTVGIGISKPLSDSMFLSLEGLEPSVFATVGPF